MSTADIIQKEKELVISRVLASSPNLRFSVGDGNYETLTREELIEHVERFDEIGKGFVKSQMEFLRAIKSGELLKTLEQSPPVLHS
jgi:hypothetical protein